MLIRNNISAKEYNSFRIDVNIPKYIEVQNYDDLNYLDLKSDYHILGGGSNILMTSDLSKSLLHINIKGKEIIKEEEDYILVKLGAGEEWHASVEWALENNYGGIENLSLIPGYCGAAPMQNIGAYGVEIKDVMHCVYVYDIEQKTNKIFHSSECNFGYRTSNFKSHWKDKYIITAIVLRLTKEGAHLVNTSYGAIQTKLEEGSISNPSIHDVSRAVIEIRRSKLPDPRVIGNAGSFFKNPIVETELYDKIKQDFPDIPAYPSGDKVKLAAGWLIDQCGWKGHQESSGVGSYKNQALVLVNNGEAKGTDVLQFAEKIIKSVKDKFEISLEPEVNIWT